MINPLADQRLAQQHFDSTLCDSLSKKHFQGEVYKVPSSGVGRLWAALTSHQYKIQQLALFYPYQPAVQASLKVYNEDQATANKYSALLSAALVYSIYNFGRRGIVAPYLREYGRFLKTHRVFRHYVHALVLPYCFFQVGMALHQMNQIETLWKVHANRLNAGILADPDRTQYPKETNRSFY